MPTPDEIEEKTNATIAALQATGHPITVTPTGHDEFFLRSIRKGPGVICTTSSKDRWTEDLFDDTEEAMEIVSRYRDSHDIYVSMGTRSKGATSRAAEYIEFLSGFFIDLDCHEGPHDYASPHDALAALKHFCKVTRLPKPDFVVSSGHGLHAHWMLSEPVERDRWSNGAHKLKQVIEAYGLKADNQVTADAARVLRIPNTLNFRDPRQPAEVELFPTSKKPALTLVEFERALDAALRCAPKSNIRKHSSTQPTEFIARNKAVDDTQRQRARVAEALRFVSADCSYEQYRDVVWALLSLGWIDAEDVARSWCLTAPHRFEEQNFLQVVGSYDVSRSPTLGTLIYFAREGGWHG